MTKSETATQTAPPTYACTFCDQPWDAVQHLLAGPKGVYICDACITLCYSIITAPPAQDAPRDLPAQDAPRDLPPASPIGPPL